MDLTRLFIALFGVITIRSVAQVSCQKFKDGTFKLSSEFGDFIIKRKGSMQTETLNAEKPNTYYVKWLDDCTYTLTMTRKTRKKYPKLPKNSFITVKIIEVKEHSYIQVSSSNFADMELTSELTKID